MSPAGGVPHATRIAITSHGHSVLMVDAKANNRRAPSHKSGIMEQVATWLRTCGERLLDSAAKIARNWRAALPFGYSQCKIPGGRRV